MGLKFYYFYSMNEEKIVVLLEEIRDLQKQHVENYKDAIKRQDQSIELQKQAIERQKQVTKKVLIYFVGLFVLYLGLSLWK